MQGKAEQFTELMPVDHVMKSGLHGEVTYQEWCEKEMKRLNADPTRRVSMVRKTNQFTNKEECCLFLMPGDRCVMKFGELAV